VVVQAIDQGFVQGCTGTSQVCPEVVHGRPEDVQGYIHGRVIYLSLVVHGQVGRGQVAEIAGMNPDLAVVALARAQLPAADTLAQRIAAVASPGGGRSGPARR
jgi:hypothetical protein